jgi:hypothetical protein
MDISWAGGESSDAVHMAPEEQQQQQQHGLALDVLQ